MRILFVTGNRNKVMEAKGALPEHEVEQLDLDIPEIQSMDPAEIIRRKLEEARSKVKEGAIMVEDVSFWIGSLGLPGPFIRYFNERIGPEGLYKIAQAFGQEDAVAECTLGLLLPGKAEPLFVTVKEKGKLVEPRGTGGFGFDPIFVPAGQTKTYAEMGKEKHRISHRTKALRRMQEELGSSCERD